MRLPSNHYDREHIIRIADYLKKWTEIPLSITGGYDIEEVKEFDKLFGTLLRSTEDNLRDDPLLENDAFIKSWLYRGPLYRIIHPCHIEDKRYRYGVRYDFPKVKYHRMVSHWTDDCSFSGLLYKLSAEEPYIILEADTKNHIAFDVNGFRKVFGFEERYTEKEREFIFPMYKECIKEYRMSISEFVELKKKHDGET